MHYKDFLLKRIQIYQSVDGCDLCSFLDPEFVLKVLIKAKVKNIIIGIKRAALLFNQLSHTAGSKNPHDSDASVLLWGNQNYI